MKKFSLLLIVLFTMIGSSVFAQRSTDIEGAKDYPTISRFLGSVIEFYKETKWGSYKLPVTEKGKLDWNNPQILEGKVTRIQYSVKGEDNVEFVLQNYKAAFNKANYKVLIAISHGELDPFPYSFWSQRYYSEAGYGCEDCFNNGKFGFSIEFPWTKNHSFIVAKNTVAGTDIYAIAYIFVKDDYLVITQDIIEIEAPETGLVNVDNLDSDITLQGHSTLYGLHFEVGKATLMPESNASLQIIAQYINANPGKKFYIVGHTDNTGDFSSNMTLSEERANSVVTELINNYQVKTEQLKAYGVSSLAPVASNTTKDGKAKNRRVEIVEQ